MKKKKQKKVLIIAAVAIVALVAVIAIFAGGGNDGGPLNTDDAKKVVLSDLGIRESKAESLHIHTTEVDGIPCYLVYITYDGHNWEYVINGLTGEILEKEESDGGHSH
jgi:uncharacterized membrane protein YkoI